MASGAKENKNPVALKCCWLIMNFFFLAVFSFFQFGVVTERCIFFVYTIN